MKPSPLCGMGMLSNVVKAKSTKDRKAAITTPLSAGDGRLCFGEAHIFFMNRIIVQLFL